MSNEIATVSVSTALSFQRRSKTGKVTIRGALGAVMSGNSIERGTLAVEIASALIESNTFAPVMDELVRVFPPSTLTKHGVIKVADMFALYDAKTKTITPIDGKWGMAVADMYCAAIVDKCDALENDGKAIKGEKDIALSIANLLACHVEEKRLAKLIAAPAPVAA